MYQTEYALYAGDELLATGTARQLAKQFRVQAKTIKFLATPSYMKRLADRRSTGKAKYAVRIED